LRKRIETKTCEKARCLSEATGTYSKAKLKTVKLFLQLVGAYAAAAAISTVSAAKATLYKAVSFISPFKYNTSY